MYQVNDLRLSWSNIFALRRHRLICFGPHKLVLFHIFLNYIGSNIFEDKKHREAEQNRR